MPSHPSWQHKLESGQWNDFCGSGRVFKVWENRPPWWCHSDVIKVSSPLYCYKLEAWRKIRTSCKPTDSERIAETDGLIASQPACWSNCQDGGGSRQVHHFPGSAEIRLLLSVTFVLFIYCSVRNILTLNLLCFIQRRLLVFGPNPTFESFWSFPIRESKAP